MFRDNPRVYLWSVRPVNGVISINCVSRTLITIGRSLLLLLCCKPRATQQIIQHSGQSVSYIGRKPNSNCHLTHVLHHFNCTNSSPPRRGRCRDTTHQGKWSLLLQGKIYVSIRINHSKEDCFLKQHVDIICFPFNYHYSHGCPSLSLMWLKGWWMSRNF